MSNWLTPREAADYCRLDPVTLRRAVKLDALQAYRVNDGTRLRYRREDLDAWLLSSPAEEAK